MILYDFPPALSPASDRTRRPEAVHERAVSRARGCWPGYLDSRGGLRPIPRSAAICAEPVASLRRFLRATWEPLGVTLCIVIMAWMLYLAASSAWR